MLALQLSQRSCCRRSRAFLIAFAWPRFFAIKKAALEACSSGRESAAV